MTYCCGILVRTAVMFADTRTNAGVDNISTFRKLHVVIQPGNASWLSRPPELIHRQSVSMLRKDGKTRIQGRPRR
jgi:putative proteasome-type protease